MKFVLALFAATSLYAQSVQSLTAQIQRTPTAALYIERGSAYLEAGDAKQAVADYDRALERDSVNLKALTLRAQAYTKLNRFHDAITDLSGAIALAPADAMLYVARSDAYAAAGDARHAKEDREEAVRLAPDALDRAREKEESAGSAPKEAIASVAPATPPPLVRKVTPPAPPKAQEPAPAKTESNDHVSAAVHYQRAHDLIYKGKHAEGRAELNEAIRMEPNNPVLYNTLGFSYYSARDYKRAIQQFDRALQLKPNYLNAMRNRALAKKGAGDLKGYEADHQHELELSNSQKR